MNLKQKILRMDKYKDAFVEVDALIEASTEYEKEKISKKFRQFIKEKKSKDYKFEIDNNLSLSQQDIMPETRNILSLMYRSYFCTEEEKKELAIEDKEYEERKEKELREKYNTDNLFKRAKNEQIQEKTVESAIVPYNDINWMKKLVLSIKEMFKKIFKGRK